MKTIYEILRPYNGHDLHPHIVLIKTPTALAAIQLPDLSTATGLMAILQAWHAKSVTLVNGPHQRIAHIEAQSS